MAGKDLSISQMTERTVLTGNEMIPFADAGENGKIRSSLLKGQEGKSAYSQAVEGGYEGTEEDFRMNLASVPATNQSVEDLQNEVEKLKKQVYDLTSEPDAGGFSAAAWNASELSPEAFRIEGNPDILREWHFMLIDTTDNAGETVSSYRKLKRNNLLRYEDGTFAPVVGITEEQRSQCDVALYLDSEGAQKYCDAGGFNAEAFYNEYGTSQKLYTAEGTEVTHILRPWETVETKYTIGLGREDTVYLLDNKMGKSGQIWKGIFKTPVKWDGIDVSAFPLRPTAISPGPVCTVGGKTRNFFFLYAGETNCQSSKGQNNLCTMFFNERTYPRVNDVQQIKLMGYARANNQDGVSPIPFAEGGFHALNTFINCLEILYGTKYLHAASLFGSGISSNDTCNNEATWGTNGGVRYKLSSDSTWKYATFSSQGDIYYQAGSRVNFTTLLNLEYPKEQCMESQMAYSFAIETGVQADMWFEFYGEEYKYQNVPFPSGAGDDMCARVYKRMNQRISAFDSAGEAVEFDVEVCLRFSLFAGANLSGDIFAYAGGGLEMVGTNNGTGLKNYPVDIYMEPDQTKWFRETVVEKTGLGTFDFESVYPKVIRTENLGDGYALRRQPNSPWKIKAGGTISTGECIYMYDNKYWSSTENARARIAARFRGYAHLGLCSPRFLNASYAVSNANRSNGGLAQVLLSPPGSTAPPQAE